MSKILVYTQIKQKFTEEYLNQHNLLNLYPILIKHVYFVQGVGTFI